MAPGELVAAISAACTALMAGKKASRSRPRKQPARERAARFWEWFRSIIIFYRTRLLISNDRGFPLERSPVIEGFARQRRIDGGLRPLLCQQLVKLTQAPSAVNFKRNNSKATGESDQNPWASSLSPC